MDCLLGTGKEGGADVATRELARHLRVAGLEVRIYTYAQGIAPPLPRFFKFKPLIREVGSFPLAGRKAMRRAEEEGCQIIHLNSLAAAALHRPGIPVVVTLHNIQAQKLRRYAEAGFHPWLFNPLTLLPFRLLERAAAANIDHFLPVNLSMERFLIEDMEVHPSRVTRIPNGVDTSLFRPSEHRGRRVIFVGRATKAKGFPTLVKAASMIEAPVLAVISKGSRAAMRRARAAGIEIRRSLPHEEVAREMSASSLLVLPSLDEEQPLVVLEAMACGLPVVTTPEGASDLVVDGINGIVVPPGDPEALAAAANRLLEDPDLALRMGRNGRALVEERHAWPRIAERITRVYLSLLEDRSGVTG